MVFESAVYTDVTSDESVDRLDGFQFQAVSDGVSGADRDVIVADMLHQKSREWPFDRDEVEHPPTAAYLRTDVGFFFSRGISTGKTNSGRDGNQLTQALIARDVADIDPYRPAQVHAAVNWRLEKAPSTRSDQWIPPLEIDDSFDSATLVDALREDPWSLSVLPAYLSMLQAAVAEPHTKILVIHDDLDTVMRWFAVGTLLLPVDDALGLGYRAFATEPFRTKAQLIGVHPDLRDPVPAGTHVIDLRARTVTEIEVTPAARRIAAWVAGHDAFDALEIAALGGRWMGMMDAETGARGAELVLGLRDVVVGRDSWDIGISLIEGLGAAGLRDDLELYFDELADSVASYRIRGVDDTVRAARGARFAADTGVTGLVEAVLVPALEALAADPGAATGWADELAASGGWQSLDLTEPERIADLFTDVILTSSDEARLRLLRLAAPLSAHLSAARVRPAIARTAAYLKADVSRATDVQDVYGGSDILAILRSELAQTVADRRAPSRTRVVSELGSGAWDFLIPDGTRDPDARTLAVWREAARIAHMPREKRAEAVSASIKRAVSDADAPSLVPACWDVVLGAAEDRDAELMAVWVLRVGLDEALRGECMRELAVVLDRGPKHTSARELKQWKRLADALAAVEPTESDHRETVEGLQRILDDIPSLADRAKDGVNSLRDLFGGKRNDSPEQGHDHRKEGA